MRLLVLIGKFSGGGAQRVAAYLSQHLPEGTETTFLVESPETHYPFEGTLRQISVSPFTGPHQYHLHLVRIMQRYREVRRAVHQLRPDTVLAFDPRWGLIGTLVSPQTVFAVRNTLSESYGKGMLERLVLGLIRVRARTVVAVSYGVSRDLRKAFGITADLVIPNAVDADAVARAGSESTADETFNTWVAGSAPIIITVGRASFQKDHGHLIRAFSAVRRDTPCKLFLVGEGIAEDPYLQELIRELGLSEDVACIGFQKNPFAYMHRAQIFVLSSLFEGFPNVILEAMASGLPVISTDCPSGPKEILAPEDRDTRYGILVPVGDGVQRDARIPLTPSEEELAGAMRQLVQDPEERSRYAQASKERVLDFAPGRFIEAWTRVLCPDKP